MATHGASAVFLQPGFYALCVNNVAARQALACAPGHFRMTHDANGIVRKGELLAVDSGESSVDGGVDGTKAEEVTDALLKRPKRLVNVTDDVQGNANDTVDDGEEGKVGKDLEKVAAEVDVKYTHAQSGPSAADNVEHVLEKGGDEQRKQNKYLEGKYERYIDTFLIHYFV